MSYAINVSPSCLIDLTDGYKVFDQLFEGFYSQKIPVGQKEIELYKSLSPNISLVKKLLDK